MKIDNVHRAKTFHARKEKNNDSHMEKDLLTCSHDRDDITEKMKYLKNMNRTEICEPDPGVPPPDLKVYTRGNPSWVKKETSFGICLTGGNNESDNAMKWMIEKSGGGDFVVLRFYDKPEELTNPESLTNYLFKLGEVDSVTTLIVDTKEKANSPYVENVLKNAEALWIVGGDQTDYFETWNDTKIDTSLEYLTRTKKIPVGGTSAGMHSMGKIIHTPEHEYDSIVSADALKDPYLKAGEDPNGEGAGVTLSDNFFNIPFMENVITDTHWSERNRMGRTLTFLARIIKDGTRELDDARAIACDEDTAVCIDEHGKAKIFGSKDNGHDDYAFFIKPDVEPTECEKGKSLDWASSDGAISVYKVAGYKDGRNSFDLNTWDGKGGETVKVNIDRGKITEDIQTPD